MVNLLSGEKLNVMLIVPHLTDGGAERVVSQLSLSLQYRYNVTVVVTEDKITYPFGGQKLVLAIDTSKPNSLWQSLKLANSLRSLKKQYSIHCSISFLIQPNLLNLLSKGSDKVILTVHTHISAYQRSKSFWSRLKNKLQLGIIYNLADKVVAVSLGSRDDLAENFAISHKRLRTIYNFYDFKEIANLAEQPIASNFKHIFNKPVILNIGRLSPSKGQWNLIRAFQHVRKYSDVHLVILGEGKLRKTYEELISLLGLQTCVFLVGFQDNPYSFMQRAELLVSSSKFEGLSNVIIEAIGLGLPVIATDCESGPREILNKCLPTLNCNDLIPDGSCGVLLPVVHPEPILKLEPLTSAEQQMSSSILTLLGDAHLRESLADKGLNRSRFFDMEQNIQNWTNLIEE